MDEKIIQKLADFELPLRVRYSETDMSGYPHHSRYFVWLEEARHALLREMGLSYRDMEENGLFFPIIDAKCRYLISVKMDDLIRIRPKILKANRRLIKIGYTIVNEKDQTVAEAETTNIAVNGQRQVISIPQKYLDFLRTLQRLS